MALLEKYLTLDCNFFFIFLSLNYQDKNKLKIDDDIVTAADLQLQEHLTCFRFLWVKDNVTQTSAVR